MVHFNVSHSSGLRIRCSNRIYAVCIRVTRPVNRNLFFISVIPGGKKELWTRGISRLAAAAHRMREGQTKDLGNNAYLQVSGFFCTSSSTWIDLPVRINLSPGILPRLKHGELLSDVRCWGPEMYRDGSQAWQCETTYPFLWGFSLSRSELRRSLAETTFRNHDPRPPPLSTWRCGLIWRARTKILATEKRMLDCLVCVTG